MIKAEEILGLRLITLHNLHFYLNLMRQARNTIEKGTFDQFRKDFVGNYKTREANLVTEHRLDNVRGPAERRLPKRANREFGRARLCRASAAEKRPKAAAVQDASRISGAPIQMKTLFPGDSDYAWSSQTAVRTKKLQAARVRLSSDSRPTT